MRQLADELHMAVGNLTYYFPRKRQIVEALMQDSFEQARADGPVETLEQINDMFSRMLDTLAHNSFYFLDVESLRKQGRMLTTTTCAPSCSPG